MEQPSITLIINGKTYRLRPDDNDLIRQMPKADRQQLIALLETVRLQDKLAEAAVEKAAAKVLTPNQTAGTTPIQAEKPHRLGAGEVDDLMARLILEEKRNKKPALSAKTIYTWAGGIILVIALLISIF